MNKVIATIVASTTMLVSGAAMAGGCCGNSYIKQQNAYGPGVHMDQYGQAVTVQPKYGHSGSNNSNRIKQRNAYGPNIHMNQYGQAVTVKPKYGYNGFSNSDTLKNLFGFTD